MNLILQHWSGEPTGFERASWNSIRAYAARIGAEYEVVLDEPMGALKHAQMHKLCMLHPDFDDYESVVMMDSDMFADADMADNIFSVYGIGIMGQLQKELRALVRKRVAELFEEGCNGDFYGGAIYKMRRHERQKFRKHLTPKVLQRFDVANHYRDEGVMHYLASMTGTVGKALDGGETWACSSYDKNVRSAKLVHIRNRITAGEEARQPKMQALQNLINAGALTL